MMRMKEWMEMLVNSCSTIKDGMRMITNTSVVRPRERRDYAFITFKERIYKTIAIKRERYEIARNKNSSDSKGRKKTVSERRAVEGIRL